MKFSPAFLSLISGVSAIDIWLNYNRNDCWYGNSIQCAGIGPNKCCAVSGQGGHPFQSIDIREIPSNWNIEMRGHGGPQCNSRRTTQHSNGRTRYCMNTGPYGGGGYGFVNRRLDGLTEDQCSTETCTEFVKPDIVSFTDGVQYNITELDDAALAEMVCAPPSRKFEEVVLTLSLYLDVAAAGGVSSDVPKKFDALIMEGTQEADA